NTITWAAYRLTPEFDWSDINYLQLIFDIMLTSINIGDIHTFRGGLDNLENQNIHDSLSKCVENEGKVNHEKTKEKFYLIVKSVHYIEKTAKIKGFREEERTIREFL